jgi:riboflavin kinase/FMN adenylyltransferase
VFDGLHRGHEYLLGALRREAVARDARPAVITFDHHPDEILRGSAPPLLCDPGERVERLEQCGVGVVVIQHFDDATRRTPYDAFVRRIAERIDLAGFLTTPDGAFGFERQGTPDAVAALGRELGYEVVIVPPLLVNGRPISSSDIRAAIERGDLGEAERLLGRPYRIVAEPKRAAADGAISVGFAMPFALPPAGEYRVRVTVPSTSEVIGAALRIGADVRIEGRLPASNHYAVTF